MLLRGDSNLQPSGWSISSLPLHQHITGCVQDVYAGPRGFYEVVLVSQGYKKKLLNKLPVCYEKSLVHIVLWRPLVEYQYILKKKCLIWVEVE